MSHGYSAELEVSYLNSLDSIYRIQAAAWERVMFELEHKERQPILTYELEFLDGGEIGKNGKSIISMTNPQEPDGAYTIQALSEITHAFRNNPTMKTAMFLSPDIGYDRDYLYVYEKQENGIIAARAFEYRGDEKSRIAFHSSLVEHTGDTQQRNNYFQPIFSQESIGTHVLASFAEHSYTSGQQKQEYQEYRTRLAASVIREQFIAAEQRQRVFEVQQHLESLMESAFTQDKRTEYLYDQIYRWASLDQRENTVVQYESVQQSTPSIYGRKYQQDENEEGTLRYESISVKGDSYLRSRIPGESDQLGNVSIQQTNESSLYPFLRNRILLRDVQTRFENARTDLPTDFLSRQPLNFSPLRAFASSVFALQEKNAVATNSEESPTNILGKFFQSLQHDDPNFLEASDDGNSSVSSDFENFFLKRDHITHADVKGVLIDQLHVLFPRKHEDIEQVHVYMESLTQADQEKIIIVLAYMYEFIVQNTEDHHILTQNELHIAHKDIEHVIALLSEDMSSQFIKTFAFLEGMNAVIVDHTELAGGLLLFMRDAASLQLIEDLVSSKKIDQIMQFMEIYEYLILTLQDKKKLAFSLKQLPKPLHNFSHEKSILEKSDTLEKSLQQLFFLITFHRLLEVMRNVYADSDTVTVEEDQQPFLAALILYLAKIKEQGTIQTKQMKKKKKQTVSFPVVIPPSAVIYSFAA